jgi:hypothetical protein
MTWKPRRPGMDGNGMGLAERGREEVDCIDLAQERVQ